MITLATLPQATAQQVYDQVKAHLLKQGKKSTNPIVLMECLYRAPGGLKCAAGCLISDEEYNPQMEGRPWRSLITIKLTPSDHELLITELQYVHDDHDPEEWAQQLKDLANRHNLIP
jgi:hypothetical protein